MRIVVQRVRTASVRIADVVAGQIGLGLLVLVGIEPTDTDEDAAWLARKIVQMRLFDDADGVPNRSLLDIDGELLLISQFTLFASTKKGNRPSYLGAAKPDIAVPLYETMLRLLDNALGKRVERGVFGADMQVSLCNDGPITICMDSRARG